MAFVRTPDASRSSRCRKAMRLPPAEPWASMPNTGEWYAGPADQHRRAGHRRRRIAFYTCALGLSVGRRFGNALCRTAWQRRADLPAQEGRRHLRSDPPAATSGAMSGTGGRSIPISWSRTWTARSHGPIAAGAVQEGEICDARLRQAGDVRRPVRPRLLSDRVQRERAMMPSPLEIVAGPRLQRQLHLAGPRCR